ncbi:MAG: adenine nucleotide alpha hydrolase [Chloroflexota bacterium]|nr:adenine nucleotide alpha hydrolase [Chloroflexota bacterium]MDE2841610.1 adenine nucleotide alpha hydrolase [Chloroflexota bacterium]MDE2931976.1 adenine nucleotide alpha hydrolase [Chloroflexota bacterium]
MSAKPVLVSWSSGKDSAWALHVLRQQPEQYDVRGIFTTVTPHFNRVAIQATPVPVLRVQAERLGLPLYEIPIPYPCSNEEYEAAMAQFLDLVRGLPPDQAADTFAFGDLFLEDIRAYREAKLAGTGFEAIFPVWGMPTAELAQTMLRSGLKAIVTAVSPTSKLDRSFAGRWFDQSFLDDLPAGTDPLGENGEFHTCVVAGPMFSRPIPAQRGEIVGRPVSRHHDGTGGIVTAWYADVELLK